MHAYVRCVCVSRCFCSLVLTSLLLTGVLEICRPEANRQTCVCVTIHTYTPTAKRTEPSNVTGFYRRTTHTYTLLQGVTGLYCRTTHTYMFRRTDFAVVSQRHLATCDVQTFIFYFYFIVYLFSHDLYMLFCHVIDWCFSLMH